MKTNKWKYNGNNRNIKNPINVKFYVEMTQYRAWNGWRREHGLTRGLHNT